MDSDAPAPAERDQHAPADGDARIFPVRITTPDGQSARYPGWYGPSGDYLHININGFHAVIRWPPAPQPGPDRAAADAGSDRDAATGFDFDIAFPNGPEFPDDDADDDPYDGDDDPAAPDRHA